MRPALAAAVPRQDDGSVARDRPDVGALGERRICRPVSCAATPLTARKRSRRPTPRPGSDLRADYLARDLGRGLAARALDDDVEGGVRGCLNLFEQTGREVRPDVHVMGLGESARAGRHGRTQDDGDEHQERDTAAPSPQGLDRVSPFSEPLSRIFSLVPSPAQGASRRSIPTPDAKWEPAPEPPLFR